MTVPRSIGLIAENRPVSVTAGKPAQICRYGQ
jgi:hypothetical protein